MRKAIRFYVKKYGLDNYLNFSLETRYCMVMNYLYMEDILYMECNDLKWRYYV